MRAAVMTNWHLRVDDVVDPTPDVGQVLTRALACGICGSDRRMLRHGREVRELLAGVDHPPSGPLPAAFGELVVTGELSIKFPFGYTPEEFASTHCAIAAVG